MLHGSSTAATLKPALPQPFNSNAAVQHMRSVQLLILYNNSLCIISRTLSQYLGYLLTLSTSVIDPATAGLLYCPFISNALTLAWIARL